MTTKNSKSFITYMLAILLISALLLSAVVVPVVLCLKLTDSSSNVASAATPSDDADKVDSFVSSSFMDYGVPFNSLYYNVFPDTSNGGAISNSIIKFDSAFDFVHTYGLEVPNQSNPTHTMTLCGVTGYVNNYYGSAKLRSDLFYCAGEVRVVSTQYSSYHNLKLVLTLAFADSTLSNRFAVDIPILLYTSYSFAVSKSFLNFSSVAVSDFVVLSDNSILNPFVFKSSDYKWFELPFSFDLFNLFHAGGDFVISNMNLSTCYPFGQQNTALREDNGYLSLSNFDKFVDLVYNGSGFFSGIKFYPTNNKVISNFRTTFCDSLKGFISPHVEVKSFSSDSYNQGFSNGYTHGFGNGSDKGYREGMTEGYNNGKSEGMEEGYNNGYTEGKSEGMTEGYSNGRTDGYIIGYNKGVNDGVDSANKYTFLSLIGAVVDAPLNVFKSMFNFEILGVNMSSFVLSLLTVSVVLFVVKLLL